MRQILSITTEEALEIQSYLLEIAKSDGLKPVAACIVDATATQLTAVTMEGAKRASIATAYAKAITVIEFQRATRDFGGSWENHDFLNGMKINPVFCSWPGGVPILGKDSRTITGAIAASNRSAQEDHDLVTAALKAADFPVDF